MSDPLTLGLASTAVSLVRRLAISLQKEARDSRKAIQTITTSRTSSAKFLTSVLELKEVIGGIWREENAELRKRLDTRARSQSGTATQNSTFAENDGQTPSCPACTGPQGGNKSDCISNASPQQDSGIIDARSVRTLMTIRNLGTERAGPLRSPRAAPTRHLLGVGASVWAAGPLNSRAFSAGDTCGDTYSRHVARLQCSNVRR